MIPSGKYCEGFIGEGPIHDSRVCPYLLSTFVKTFGVGTHTSVVYRCQLIAGPMELDFKVGRILKLDKCRRNK